MERIILWLINRELKTTLFVYKLMGFTGLANSVQAKIDGIFNDIKQGKTLNETAKPFIIRVIIMLTLIIGVFIFRKKIFSFIKKFFRKLKKR